jgi:polysaccharide biosynthesis protein VpsJ
MATMTASAGKPIESHEAISAAKLEIYNSILRLFGWLESNNYRGYDTFDGLNSKLLRPLTFENPLLRTVLQQGVRRFPLNLRPVLGVPQGYSTKGMGYLARGFMRMHEATGSNVWAEKAEFALGWLVENQSPGYSGACWGNHFDYQSRSFYLPKGTPTIVWSSLIGHAFLDGYNHFKNKQYLQVADSVGQHIMRDLRTHPEGEGACINYIPGSDCWVHNSNTLGGSFLARTYSKTRNGSYLARAQQAMRYTAQHQRTDGSWFYGQKENLRWVDNFHTAYVLDCFRYYSDSTGDHSFDQDLSRGYDFWKNTFFLADGTPRYYDHKTLPIDIQCASQAIDTFVFFSDRDPEALQMALKIAYWTIANMQDETGYFYYRRYSSWLVNKTPTLHWGQATMMCALAGLYRLLTAKEY